MKYSKDIKRLECFDPEVTHMIVFDVHSNESPIGDKGHRMRLFLTEAGYKKALESQDRSFIKILNHEKVAQGHLQYDRQDGELQKSLFPKSKYRLIDSQMYQLLYPLRLLMKLLMSHKI